MRDSASADGTGSTAPGVAQSLPGSLESQCLRTIRAAGSAEGAKAAVVRSMAYDTTGTVVATGGADRIVHVYDIRRGYCTHALRGHASPVHLTQFHPVPSRLQLFSAAEDRTIRAWDLVHKQAQTDGGRASSVVLKRHAGVVAAIAFSADGWTMLSAGRDQVVLVWALFGLFRALCSSS